MLTPMSGKRYLRKRQLQDFLWRPFFLSFSGQQIHFGRSLPLEAFRTVCCFDDLHVEGLSSSRSCLSSGRASVESCQHCLEWHIWRELCLDFTGKKQKYIGRQTELEERNDSTRAFASEDRATSVIICWVLGWKFSRWQDVIDDLCGSHKCLA